MYRSFLFSVVFFIFLIFFVAESYEKNKNKQ